MGSLPERESPATSAKVHRADRKAAGWQASRQTDKYHDREVLLKSNPAAHNLSVYDGRILVGRVVDLGPRLPCAAFDASDTLVGVFPSRNEAFQALPKSGGRS